MQQFQFAQEERDQPINFVLKRKATSPNPTTALDRKSLRSHVGSPLNPDICSVSVSSPKQDFLFPDINF